MSDAVIISIISLVSSVLAGLGVKWYELRKKVIQERKSTEHRNRLHNILVVYKAIEDIVAKGYVDRAILFIGSNGGARPRPGHVYQVSAVHASCNKESTEVILDKFKVVRVDAQYIELLLNLMNAKDCVYYDDVSIMPEGRLKDIYLGEGINSSSVYYLGHSEEELYFCSFANYHAPVLTQQTKPVLSLTVDVIRNSFSLYSINQD
jgi:hypothetical protein